MSARPPALERRRHDLDTLTREDWDLLVVGGGIVGAGTLLDATSRGLRAALVEQGDVASGTSSRSSRLIHGGLRYLEQFHFGLVREALAERTRLIRLAPHLVRPEPFLFPVYGAPFVHRAFYGSGLVMYDLLGSARRVGRSHHLGSEAARELAPPLRRDGLRGGIVYHDAVEDDARYALAVLRTAQSRGAVAVTRVRATKVLEEDRRVRGIEARDTLSGDTLTLRAARVVDATGVWAGRPGSSFAGTPAALTPSRGAHLVVRRERLPLSMGMTIRVPGKVVFIVPWPGYWLIGTTDVPDAGAPESVAATASDVDELLSTVNHTLQVDLSRTDICGTYAGLRPLVGALGIGSTIRASREHRVQVDRSGLVRVSGGKYTTYRVMAADAVDAALGQDARFQPSATAELPIIGAAHDSTLDRLVASLATAGLAPGTASGLVARHGTEADDVAELGRATGTMTPLAAGLDHLEAEVIWAIRHELALSIDDLLARRTRLAQELPDRGEAIVERVSALAAVELGWDEARRTSEVASYLEGARAAFGIPLI